MCSLSMQIFRPRTGKICAHYFSESKPGTNLAFPSLVIAVLALVELRAGSRLGIRHKLVIFLISRNNNFMDIPENSHY